MSEKSLGHAFRFIARVTSVVSLFFCALAFSGFFIEGDKAPLEVIELVMLVFFPTGVCAGMIISWFREKLGGIVSVSSLICFYATEFAASGSLADGPFFFLITSPALLFLLSAHYHNNPTKA